jgi:hypothetical protein
MSPGPARVLPPTRNADLIGPLMPAATTWRTSRIVAAFGAAALLPAAAGCGGRPYVNDTYTDAGVVHAMEERLADAVAALEAFDGADFAFPGFVSRSVTIDPCYYGTSAQYELEDHSLIAINVAFDRELWEESVISQDYPRHLAEVWKDQGYEVEIRYDGTGDLTDAIASDDDGMAISADATGLHSWHEGCVPDDPDRAVETDPPPTGVSEEHDTLHHDSLHTAEAPGR